MRRPPLLILLPVAVLLAGCTAPALNPVATLTSAASAPASSAPAPSVTPLPEPVPMRGEIARGEVGPTTVYRGKGDVPRSARFVYVHAGCSGPAGSTMHFELQNASGRRFGPSADLPCNEGFSTAGSAVAGDRGTRAQVLVAGDDGVIGYAVLSTSAER